jgi:predicted PurR-regulated permease PerM
MLYLLFFFFRDGAKLSSIIMHHIPLGAGYETRLMERFSQTAQAVVKGTLAIAVLQGIIGGILFLSVGISNPVLWGVAMAVLSVVPLFGTALIWVPAALAMIFTGSLVSGIIIILVGAFVISVVDEFLRPILVGRGTKMPDALVLLAIIGGLATFGVSGFIIGPIIAALFLSLWSFFEERYRTDLLKN